MMTAMSRGRGLFGREAVLAAASTVLADAEAGAGQFLLVSGEAGIGKTSVLAALIDEAQQSGAVVLRGYLLGGHRRPAVLAVVTGHRVPRGLPAQTSVRRPDSVDDVPERRRRADGRSRPPVDAEFRLFEAVAACLRDLSDGRFVTVVIDDLHWADEPSLRLLGFLTRALAGSAVLVARRLPRPRGPA